MTDNETMNVSECKTLAEGEKIKAIYPHITVTGDVDNPYYNIDWYDIEKQTMYRGYSSYKLPLVRKWLQENFEVVEADIDDLINRQQAEIENYIKVAEYQQNLTLKKSFEIKELKAEIERLEAEIDKQYEQAKADILGNMADGGESCHWCIDEHRKNAIKEFAERLKEKLDCDVHTSEGFYFMVSDTIDNLAKEMVGEDK